MSRRCFLKSFLAKPGNRSLEHFHKNTSKQLNGKFENSQIKAQGLEAAPQKASSGGSINGRFSYLRNI